ncbi:hypothetical protein JR316_0002904 [Psilocybe cubensis]|uniref:Uncharacterized protein n=2 Tax=Psilocybe cubensis TaxID=181762 RepID=A0A8H7Y3Y6_PSICU|nr:hypothetical protein JR316_0002904 [Psilocybe cubensis]KAH9483436.1 hypothetical protein JR316_0002904 [Psilocybe cubensis]
MKFAISAAVLSFVGLASATSIAARQSCPQATRFGIPSVTPSTVSAGDSISITVDLTCGVTRFGIVPEFLDYSIEVPAEFNNGFQQAIILARRAIPAGALSDSFTTTVPHGYFVANSPYNVVVTNIYNINGTDGSPVLVKGGVLQPITINV